MRKALVLTVVVLGLLWSASAMADVCGSVSGNLVANCGFETGDFTGWTLGGNTSNPGDFYFGVDGFDANSGNDGAYMGAAGSPVTLSQSFNTLAGHDYVVTFWLEQDSPGPDGTNVLNFAASWGGTNLVSLTPTVSMPGPVGVFTEYQFTEMGTGGPKALNFSFRNDDSFWSFDDVSVVQTPEPSSCLLLASAIFGLAGFRRFTGK